ncbi:MAG: (d)CMP kinase, partial [SAR202 cluster bacterium]|nr:(d)CMP kinase [SAR202 cluster bacterium]
MNGDHLHSPNSVRPAIAIDGPAASGKSSAGKMFASQLGYRFLDTGLMYRAATWDVMNNGIDINESEAVSRVVGKMEFSVIDGESGENLILVNGQDVTRFLHSTAVDISVSPVSAITAVRKIMVAEQRRIAATGSIVMVGRDIGTVVIPNAPLKIFLTASAETRAN